MLRFLSTSLLFVFYVAALGTNTAWGAPKPISGCTRITARGPYVLTNSINATLATMTPTWNSGAPGCIVIAAK